MKKTAFHELMEKYSKEEENIDSTELLLHLREYARRGDEIPVEIVCNLIDDAQLSLHELIDSLAIIDVATKQQSLRKKMPWFTSTQYYRVAEHLRETLKSLLGDPQDD